MCNATVTIASVASEGDNLSSSIKKMYTTQGTDVGNGKLYLHDNTLENGANDGSYRYAGADPDNYLCFEGDDCSNEDNLYRIIGVFDNQIKLIKYNYINMESWNNKASEMGGDGDTSDRNVWEDSSLEAYLNGEYLNSLGDKDLLLKEAMWSIGGVSWDDINKTFKEFYDIELNNNVTINKKIGLMYVTDYLYSALSEQYTNSVFDYSRLEKDTKNWLMPKILTWTITRDSSSSSKVFTIYDYGYISYDSVDFERCLYPTFYLKENVLYVGGMGTSGDPIIVAAGPTASDIIKAQYTSQGSPAGENGVIYLHDATLANGANDGSYRYAGTDPDNYLCFEGDTCDDDHKYRIIGIFGENIKVIKMTSVGDKVWNSSNVNTWDGSTMDTYLNGEWLTSFGHSDLIEDYDWHVGGHSSSSVTAKVMYDAEIASTPVVNRKVGLMYASDYGYGALNNYWTTNLVSYDGGAMNTDWLYLKAYEWTISRHSGNFTIAFRVISTGLVYSIYSYVNDSYASRPSFYLRSSVDIKSGSGSKENPWIIGA